MAERRRSSLRDLLIRQWLIFAAASAALVAAGALLLAFLVEDGLIDRRLMKFAGQLAVRDAAELQLPPELAVYRLPETPIDIAARMRGRAPGEVFELRRANGANLHVVVQQTASGETLVVTYDATDVMIVGSAIGTGLIAALVLAALFLLSAWLMADRLVRRVARHAESLEATIRLSEEPARLHAAADAQEIREFGSLLHLHAALWEQERRSVDNERATLAYLAHELRTPMQSALNSVAAIADARADAGADAGAGSEVGSRDDLLAIGRLRRAIARLERASTAALWLASEAAPQSRTPTLLGPILDELIAEFEPLARARGQSFTRSWEAGAQSLVPVEIVEVIVANILQNAIRHGAPGSITIQANDHEIRVVNAADGRSAESGFGFGLKIVSRLSEQAGGSVAISSHDGCFTTTVRLPAPGADGGA